jgi:hypothetical protein
VTAGRWASDECVCCLAECEVAPRRSPACGPRGERLPRTTVRLCGVLPDARDLSLPRHVAIYQVRHGAKLTKMVGHLLRGCHGLDRHRVERGPGRRRQRDAAGRVGHCVLRRLRQLSVCRFPPAVLRGPVAGLFQPWRARAWSCVRCHAVSLPARRPTDARCGRRTRVVRMLRPRRLRTDGFRAASRFLTIEVRRLFHQRQRPARADLLIGGECEIAPRRSPAWRPDGPASRPSRPSRGRADQTHGASSSSHTRQTTTLVARLAQKVW